MRRNKIRGIIIAAAELLLLGAVLAAAALLPGFLTPAEAGHSSMTVPEETQMTVSQEQDKATAPTEESAPADVTGPSAVTEPSDSTAETEAPAVTEPPTEYDPPAPPTGSATEEPAPEEPTLGENDTEWM